MPTRAKEKEHFKSIEEYLLDRGWRKNGPTKETEWSIKRGGFVEHGCLEWSFGAQIEDDANEGGWRVTGITLEKRT